MANKSNQPHSSVTTDPKKPGFSDRIGNLVEKAGHKISEAGAPALGQKIHDLGDKIEKSHTNPRHPHKT